MRRWSSLLFMPCVIACAAVLGLEEAELDDDDGSVGGRANTGGNTSRAGKSGTGGDGSVVSCGYDEAEDRCFWGCVNDSCCSEWVSCFEDPKSTDCADYFDCHAKCEGDSACETACGKTHQQGLVSATVLSLCLYGQGNCPCLESSEGGAGGVGGTPPIVGGRPNAGAGGRSGSGGVSGRGGAGGSSAGGSAGSCRETDPTYCVNASTLGYCEAGQRRSIACTDGCAQVGFDPSGAVCEGIGCRCGEALDPACYIGTLNECYCNYDDSCSQAQLNQIYSTCYNDSSPGWRTYILCLDTYGPSAPDCGTLVTFCENEAGVP